MTVIESALTNSNPGILYVITDLNRGGVPLHLLRLALAMRSRGFDPTVVSLAPSGAVAAMLEIEGITVRSCEGRGGWDARILKRLTRIISEQQPALVHAMLFHANVAARWAAHKAGMPRSRVLCEIQTVEIERPWHLWVDRWTHRSCRLTIGNSPSVIEHLAKHARIPQDCLRLIRGGIDPTIIEQADPLDRAAIEVPRDVPLILWTGRLDPIKGLDVLIKSFQSVAADAGAHLVLAGDGSMRAELQRLISGLNLNERVHLLGARGDVPSLLRTADLFVFPSRTEGLPNALLEAMAAGLPIVTTDVPGCRDLVTHDDTGLLVPYGDTRALTGAMLRLTTDRALAARLGAGARETVSARWHINHTLDGYEQLYRRVLDDEIPTLPR